MFKYTKMVCKAGNTLIKSHHRIKKYARHPEKYSNEERFNYIRDFLLKLNDKALHGYFIVNGLQNVPEGQVLFTPNHTSNADPITMLITSDRPISILAKKEIQKMPYVRSVSKALKCNFIDRYNLRSEIKTFKAVDKLLTENKDLSYVIFPEGTRSTGPDFNVNTFHPGSFKVAVKKQLPIVPVCIYLSARAVNVNYSYKVYPIQVSYLKPLFYEDYKDMTVNELASYVQELVEDELVHLKEKDPQLVSELNNYSLKKTNKVLLRKTKKPKHPSEKKIEKNNKKYSKEEKKLKLQEEKNKLKQEKLQAKIELKQNKNKVSTKNKLITVKENESSLKRLEEVNLKNEKVIEKVNQRYQEIEDRINQKEEEFCLELDRIYSKPSK